MYVTHCEHFQQIFQINSADRASIQCFSNNFLAFVHSYLLFLFLILLSSVYSDIKRHNIQFSLIYKASSFTSSSLKNLTESSSESMKFSLFIELLSFQKKISKQALNWSTLLVFNNLLQKKL